MNRQQLRQAERTGKRLAKKHPSVQRLARQDAINSMCYGATDTDFHRALANIYMDFKEGKISKERYEELVNPLIGR